MVATGNNTNTTINGVTPAYEVVHNISMANGSFISEANQRGIGRQAILGATVATDLFGDEDPIGKVIRISKINFTVAGIMTKKGGAGSNGAASASWTQGQVISCSSQIGIYCFEQ